LMLALALRGADGAADGAIEAAQLSLGAGIHIAHAADHRVRLVVEIKTVLDEFFQVDFGRALGASAVEAAPVSTLAVPALAPLIAGTSPFARRTAFPIALFRFLCHLLNPLERTGVRSQMPKPLRAQGAPRCGSVSHLNLRHQAGPFERHQAGRAKLD